MIVRFMRGNGLGWKRGCVEFVVNYFWLCLVKLGLVVLFMGNIFVMKDIFKVIDEGGDKDGY